MKDSAPSLYAYIVTSVCVIIFYILKWENFITLVKPVIVPAIYYYYLQTTKRPINIMFSIAIWLFFVADMIEIVDAAAGIYLIMTCNLISYTIMFRFAILEHVKLRVTWKSAVPTLIIAATIAIVCAFIIGKTGPSNTIYFYYFIVYTIIFLSMICYSILRILTNNDVAARLFMSMVAVMFFSDILYASNNYVKYIMPLAIVSFISQFISYYFMVEYFSKRGSVAKQIEI